MSKRLQAYYDLIGKLVKNAREQQSMPVWMLAILAGAKPNDIVRLENGCPGVQSHFFLSKIARALGIPVESIQPSEGW